MKKFTIIAIALATTALLGACDTYDDDGPGYVSRTTRTTYYNDGYYPTGYSSYYGSPVVVRRSYY
jgi:hypothetical protein